MTAPRSDETKAHPARIYSYLLGGKNHAAADRAAAEVALNAQPDLREMATANRAFLHRTVSYLAKRGITQYLDIGPGYPDAGNTAEVSRAHQLRARVAFADYDPYVVAHTRALLESTGAAHTAVVHADLRTPTEILEHPHVKKLFDFDQPIAVLLVAVLHFIGAEDDPASIVATLRGALAPGSALVISHGTDGGQPERAAATAKGWETATSPVTVRSPDEIRELFAGFELVDPGIVPIAQWRPDSQLEADRERIWVHGGIGILPEP